MSDRVLSVITLASQGQEATRELPMPVIAFFLITFVLFLLLLGVTWSFRNTAYKVQPPRPAPEQPGAPGTAVTPERPHH